MMVEQSGILVVMIILAAIGAISVVARRALWVGTACDNPFAPILTHNKRRQR